MFTLYKNPYQSFLDTEIANRKYDGEYYHLILKDSLSFDYRQFNLPEEALTINKHPLVKSYLAGKDIIHVTKNKPQTSQIELSLNEDYRRLNQREVTLRLLMMRFFDLYYATDKISFSSERENNTMKSTAKVRGILDKADADYLMNQLEKSVSRLIRAGLSVRSQEISGAVESTIYGQGKQPWRGPHLFNTAEIYRFELGEYLTGDDILTYQYRLL